MFLHKVQHKLSFPQRFVEMRLAVALFRISKIVIEAMAFESDESSAGKDVVSSLVCISSI